MAKLEIVKDSEGNKIVLIPEILFFNKQNIEWELVEQYLEKYVGEIVEIAETREVVYIGKKFPDEYSGSLYTRKSKGARAKAKANAAQGIMEMIEIAAQKVFCENRKEKLLPALKTEVSEKIGAIKNFWNISQRANLFM